MGNVFATAPKLVKPFPIPVDRGTMWTCPRTGFVVPKDPDINLLWRADLLEAAEDDVDLQADLMTASSQSILFWINTFVFTLRVFEPTLTGKVRQAEFNHLPMVTWPIQDDHIEWIEQKIDDGEEGLTDKSRDMSATWNHLVVYTHRLLFRGDESHLMISRKENVVDMLDGLPKEYPHGILADPGTLFGKIDYTLSRLPEWMIPRLMRKKLHLVNIDNNTRIDGESANSTAGSSDRRTSIFLDEMAKMREGAAIKRSTRAVSACRLPNSTPNGAGTAYSKWRTSGQIDVFELPWWEHPQKGVGRYVEHDPTTGRYKIRSPWYDAECRESSPKEVAIEIDMDHVGSGDTFFEESILEEHRRLYAFNPRTHATIDFVAGVADDDVPTVIDEEDVSKVRVKLNRKTGPWRIWCELDEETGRPNQDREYIFGVDISKGQGASNSVISVMRKDTREKVAEFADANTPPYTLARVCVAAMLWFGGAKLPYLVWENNGDPGFDFGNQMMTVYYYPNVYFDRQPGTVAKKRGKRYGWRSDAEAKAVALGVLRRAYAHGGWVTHAHESLDEASTYVHYDDGGIGPAELTEESASARKTHGDRVIADMLCLVGAGDLPKGKRTSTRAPERSFAGRRAAHFKKKKRQAQRDRFNWG